MVDPAWAPRGFVDVLGAAAERLRDGPGGFGRGEVPTSTRAVFVGHPHRRGADPSRAGAGAGGVPWDDERRVLMRRRVSYARRVRPSRPVTRPPSYRVEVSRPARASKTGGLENFSFFNSGAKLFTTKQGCRQVSVVDWTRSGTRRNQRVRSSRPLASRQLRSSKKGRATTTSPLNDQCLRRPRRPRPFQDFTQPSSRVPSRRTHPDPRVPRGVHTAPARHAAREPPSGASRSRARAPRSRVFKPRREPPLTRHAPRGSARDDRRTMGLMCANPACTRGVRPKPSPRVPNSPPLGPSPPPRRPKGAHLQKPTYPKPNEIPK